MQIQLTPAQRDRFWSLVDKSGGFFACWPWCGYRILQGYGRTTCGRRRSSLTHRVAWALTHGPIPDDIHVLHQCDNPPCCNPAHLWLGTDADNCADKERKGRHNPARGEQNGQSTLIAEQVRAIRRRYAAGGVTVSCLAREYGVSRRLIDWIVAGQSWRHVD